MKHQQKFPSLINDPYPHLLKSYLMEHQGDVGFLFQ